MTSSAELEARVQLLRAAYQRDPFPTLEQRLKWLAAVGDIVERQRDALCDAVTQDFGHRARSETLLGDFWVTRRQLAYVRRNLADWMQPQPAEVPLPLLPGRAFTLAQPRGVVAVFSPWNYPVMLALTPLIAGLAAGNRVVLKLSERTPRTSQLLADGLLASLGQDVVLPLVGDAELGRSVSGLPLDMILFTGSTEVGREVARVAAQRMTPVVLELGGKCPALLTPEYSVEAFAKSVVQGKCFNAGQSCVSPDYLLIPEGQAQNVTRALEREVSRRFPTLRDNPDYTSVVGDGRLLRLKQLRDEAISAGAQCTVINPAKESIEGGNKLPLTLLYRTPDSCRVMQEEIFGPLLPVVEYATLDVALRYIAERPRPLALYYFDNNALRVQDVLERSVSGGVTINDTLVHFITDSLPRTGVGASGMGAYQGAAGFMAFSHVKSVFRQPRWNGTGLLAPPYRGLTTRIIDWLLKI